MRVLLTGATGFLGRRLVSRLEDDGHELMLISRKPNAGLSVGTKWIVTDIASADKCWTDIEQFEPESVFHLAWEGIPDFSEILCRKNLVNSLNFLGPIVKLPSVTRLIVAGSCWEYGAGEGACREDRQMLLDNWFAWAKSTLRSYLERACSDENVKLFWMRVFFVYGPGQRSASLIPTVAQALIRKKKPDLRSPYSRNDFIYVDDVIDGFAMTLTTEAPPGIYNLGSGQNTTVIDVVRCIEKELSAKSMITVSIEAGNELPRDPLPSIYSDISKSRDVLGWMPTTELTDGIKSTLGHLG